jgi:hypothetical protein
MVSSSAGTPTMFKTRVRLWVRTHSAISVATAPAHLHGAERVLGGLAPHAHSTRIFVEPVLHRLQHILVLPARDAALRAWV